MFLASEYSEVKGLSDGDLPLLWRSVFSAVLVIPVDVSSFFDDETVEVEARNRDRDGFQLVEVFVVDRVRHSGQASLDCLNFR